MKRYNIKSQNGKTEFIDILKDLVDDFLVRLTRDKDGFVKTSEETMSRHLFEMCLKTGYLTLVCENIAA